LADLGQPLLAVAGDAERPSVQAKGKRLGSFYVSGTIRTSAFARYGDTYKLGLRYTGGTQAAPIGSPMNGTFTAIGGNTNKIVWQHKTPYRVGQGGGSTTTAGGLVFSGEPDGNFLAINAKTGEELWRFQGSDNEVRPEWVDLRQYAFELWHAATRHSARSYRSVRCRLPGGRMSMV
jgi:outer membrane protein assembly factor BamB